MTDIAAAFASAQARKFLPVSSQRHEFEGVQTFGSTRGQIVGTDVELSTFLCARERAVDILGKHDSHHPIRPRITSISGFGYESAEQEVFKLVTQGYPKPVSINFERPQPEPAFINIGKIYEGGALYLGIRMGAFLSAPSGAIRYTDVLNKLQVEKGQWIMLPPDRALMASGVDIDIVHRADQSLEPLGESRAIFHWGGGELGNVDVLKGNLPRRKQDPNSVVRTSLGSWGVFAERLEFPRRGAVCTIDTDKRGGLLAVTSGEVMLRARGSSYRHLLGGHGGIVFHRSRVIAHPLMASTMLFVKL